jgi:LysR family hydrogen peroxide-inducible transcriptional activator
MPDLDGEFYLSRIGCEFYNVLDDLCREHGLVKSYQSEREDWILTMVAAGMGVCFLPEYTATFPGVVGCPVVSPSVERNVCLVTVAGHRRLRHSCKRCGVIPGRRPRSSERGAKTNQRSTAAD